MTIATRIPAKPRAPSTRQPGVQITQNPLMPKPEVPDGVPVTYEFVDSLLLTLPVANADLKVVVRWWPQVSEDLWISPQWGDAIINGFSQQVTAAQVADQTSKWEFTIPQASLTVHGRFPLRYVTSTLPDGNVNEEQSDATYVLVDRVAPGGEELPMLEITTLADRVITLADLNADDELESTVADYYDMKEGDLVTAWIGAPGGSGEYLDSSAHTVTESEVATKNVRLLFPKDKLELYGDGKVLFSYKLKDLAGNETTDHATPVSYDVVLETAPGTLLPPLVPANDDGLITDADARVPVVIQIPQYVNAAAGDEITVRWGTQDVAVVSLLPGEELRNPMKDIPITYADLLAASPGAVPVSVNVTYSVKRGPISFPSSPPTTVKVDLSIPGGPDPDPETPENENLKAPLIAGASGTPNNITIPDYGLDAGITIPWQTADAKPAFQANDVLKAYWGATPTPFLNVTLPTAPTADTRYTIAAAVITAELTGDRPVWYTITRNLSTPPQSSTAKSMVQMVKVESNKGHPGDGNPLVKPDFPEAKRTGTTLYIDRAAGLDGTTVRAPLTDTNIAAGDLISLTFTGYSTQDGTGAPIVNYQVPNREITGPEFAAQQAIIVIPTNVMRQICYGSARATYTVTNASGGTASTLSDLVNIWLRSGSDNSCTAPF